MKRNAVETVLGAVVLLVAGMFVYFAYTTAQVQTVHGYQIKAKFFKIGGLTTGSDVRVSGIKVGTVTDSRLDPVTFDAIVDMTIKADVKLPKDTVASIGSDGIVGGKYISLRPGPSKDMMTSDDTVAETRDFRSLEDQVGEIIFLATGGSDK